MKKFNKKLLDNFISPYYDNLENIFEYKNYDDISKNMITQIISKTQIGIKDQKTVKGDTYSQNTYIEDLLNILRFKVNSIKIVGCKDKAFSFLNNSNFYINYNQKAITCVQKEEILLRAIYELGKNYITFTGDQIANIALNSLLNQGLIEDRKEPVRDFTRYCWTINKIDIDNKISFIIYQILNILLNSQMMEDIFFTKNTSSNTLEMIRAVLEQEFEFKKSYDFIISITKLALLYAISKNEIAYNSIANEYAQNMETLKQLQNPKEFLSNLKKEQVRLIQILNSHNYLLTNKQALYNSFMATNPPKSRVNINTFYNHVIEQKKEIENELNEINSLFDQNIYNQFKQNLQTRNLYLSVINSRNISESIYKEFLNICKIFLKMLHIRVNKIDTRKYLDLTIIQFRYFLNLYVTNDLKVLNIYELRNDFEDVIDRLFAKVKKQNRMNYFCNDTQIQKAIFSQIFSFNIVDLEKVYVKLKKEVIDDRQILVATYYEDEQIILKYNICQIENPKELDLRLNKKYKLFF